MFYCLRPTGNCLMKFLKSLHLPISEFLPYLLMLLFAYSLIRLFSPVPAFAQSQFSGVTGAASGQINGSIQYGRGWIDAGIPEAYKDCKDNNGVNVVCFTAGIDVYSQANLITQIIPVRGISYGITETDQKYIAGLYDNSAIGGINKGIAYMVTNPPADLALWVRDTGETLGFLPKSIHAQGQGIGFTGLAPLLGIWRGFRNIAYALVALMMVVIGFMVMFRKKIDPKTVVTVQNALPRIVVVLLLITFSYAIVGLMIDLMYLVTGIGITLLNTALPGGSKISIFGMTADLVNGGFLTLIGSVFAPVINTTGVVQLLGGIQAGNLQSAGNALPGLVAAVATGVVPSVLLWLIISLAYLFGFVRIFFMLLMAYVNIIMSVLVGPIQILFDALPGSNSFVSWLKNLFLNLIPFPITIFMLILGNALSNSFGTNQLWTPPLLPQWGISSSFATTILWLGIIMTIPSVVGSIKEAIKTKAAMPSGVGTIVGPLGAGVGQVVQLGYQASFIASARRHAPIPPSDVVPRQIQAGGGKGPNPLTGGR